MYCRTCGAQVENHAPYCKNCGCLPQSGTKHCPNCGVETLPNQVVCVKCGTSFTNPNQFKNETYNTNWIGLSKYYTEEFTKIKNSGEQYKGKFNWAAFLFGPLWALTKGLWIPALVAFLMGTLTAGVVLIAYWIIFGFRGNYMYYNKFVKNKTLFI